MPSGAPKSLNLTPLTGIGTCPRNDAKATAGASRPGSRKADSAGRLSLRAASRAARDCRVEALFELGDQIFEIVGLLRQIGGARALGGERLLALGLLLLPLRRSAPPCVCVRRRARRLRLRSRSRSAAMFLRTLSKLGEIAAPARRPRWRISGSTAPSNMAVRTDCSASSGLDDQRRRRPAADALQRRQHFADDGAAAVERLADARLVVVERLRAGPRSRQSWLRHSRERAAVSIRSWLSLRRSAPISSISRLSAASVSADLRCCSRALLEFLVALLQVRRHSGLCRCPFVHRGSQRKGQRQTQSQRRSRVEAAETAGANHCSQNYARLHGRQGDCGGNHWLWIKSKLRGLLRHGDRGGRLGLFAAVCSDVAADYGHDLRERMGCAP